MERENAVKERRRGEEGEERMARDRKKKRSSGPKWPAGRRGGQLRGWMEYNPGEEAGEKKEEAGKDEGGKIVKKSQSMEA